MVAIILVFLKELAWSMFAKLSLKALAERFASRLVIWGLEKLKNGTENAVVEQTVEDILTQLEGKLLKVVDERQNIRRFNDRKK